MSWDLSGEKGLVGGQVFPEGGPASAKLQRGEQEESGGVEGGPKV